MQTMLTGSYPQFLDESHKTKTDIATVIQDQIDCDMSILVDGQLSDDIASLFAGTISPNQGEMLPLKITQKVASNSQSIGPTRTDFAAAMQEAKKHQCSKPFKAHLSGPMFLACNCHVESSSSYQPYKPDAPLDSNLLMDIATVLAQEAKLLYEAGAQYIQVDEPGLAYGPDLDLAFAALNVIRDAAPNCELILHVCGDVTDIAEKLASYAPVDILSVEWEHLKKVDASKLSKRDTRIALGCLSVNTNDVEKQVQIDHIVQNARRLLGDRLFALTPNCGLRLSTRKLAQLRMQLLRKAAI